MPQCLPRESGCTDAKLDCRSNTHLHDGVPRLVKVNVEIRVCDVLLNVALNACQALVFDALIALQLLDIFGVQRRRNAEQDGGKFQDVVGHRTMTALWKIHDEEGSKVWSGS